MGNNIVKDGMPAQQALNAAPGKKPLGQNANQVTQANESLTPTVDFVRPLSQNVPNVEQAKLLISNIKEQIADDPNSAIAAIGHPKLDGLISA